jgi:hypothetical protein
MAHRKTKRAAVAAAGSIAAAAGRSNLSDIPLDDGSAVLGPRADTASIRDDASWRVREAPQCFKMFHDVICGATRALFLTERDVADYRLDRLTYCRTSHPLFRCLVID